MQYYAITLWPEWIWAIRFLGKDIENRPWRLPLRFDGVPVLLHAGKAPPKKDESLRYQMLREMAEMNGWATDDRPNSVLFMLRKAEPGVVRDVLVLDKRKLTCGAVVGSAVFTEEPMERIGGWRAEGQYHWCITDTRWFANPLPSRGYQKFWPSDVNVKLVNGRPTDLESPLCCHGDGKPVCPPSKVLCKEHLNELNSKFRQLVIGERNGR